MFTPSPSGKSATTARRFNHLQARPASTFRASRPSTPAQVGASGLSRAESIASVRTSPPAPSSVKARSAAPSKHSHRAVQSADNDADQTLGADSQAGQSAPLEAGAVLKHDGFTAITVLSQLPREVRKALEATGEYSLVPSRPRWPEKSLMILT